MGRLNPIIERNVMKRYEGVGSEEKESIIGALDWAKATLTNHEGEGHDFHLHATKEGMFQCSFAKPSWAGDHVSRPMSEAPEAVVMAVCEYLSGV